MSQQHSADKTKILAMQPTPQPLKVIPLAMCKDNYAWLIHNGVWAWVLDPGDADVVIAAIDRLQLTLKKIIITHRHWDHVNGIEALHNRTKAPVYGPRNTHPFITHYLKEGDRIELAGIALEVWHTPGHTEEHLSYYQPNLHWLFCGDTLFSAGCGRILATGNLEQLYTSLSRIRQLPPQTVIFCSHEYTASNLDFATVIEPENTAISAKVHEVRNLREHQQPTLPTRLDQELTFNPFLRLHQPAVQARCQNYNPQQFSSDPFVIFSILRTWKNSF